MVSPNQGLQSAGMTDSHELRKHRVDAEQFAAVAKPGEVYLLTYFIDGMFNTITGIYVGATPHCIGDGYGFLHFECAERVGGQYRKKCQTHDIPQFATLSGRRIASVVKRGEEEMIERCEPLELEVLVASR